ncbi:MAG: hypothetical protein K8T10_13475 [Candidatus Eremiobacteraeota bacterium]|nr:hypothetical protein [Candidatus Eremiobacteraeota bacterium]
MQNISMEQRLLELEKKIDYGRREMKIWKILTAMSLLIVLIFFFINRSSTVNAYEDRYSDTDYTKRVIIKDSLGRLRVFLGVSEGEPVLDLLDGNGTSRLKAQVLKDGAPLLRLYDSDGKIKLGLAVLTDGSSSLIMPDGNGIPRAGMTVSQEGLPALSLLAGNGKSKAKISVSSKDQPMFSISNKNNVIIWKAP